MRVILCDVNPEIKTAWDTVQPSADSIRIGEFSVRVHCGSIFGLETDAIVSPANSFGFMDGGIDARYLEFFGKELEHEVRSDILSKYGGELVVGNALSVRTKHAKVPYLIAAPTMRVPMRLPSDTINPYLAVRAALKTAQMCLGLQTIAFPGMGTGTGCVPLKTFVRQAIQAVRAANSYVLPYNSTQEAMNAHYALVGGGEVAV